MPERRTLQRHFPSWTFVIVAVAAVGLLAAGLLYSGVYNVGADAPHFRLVYNGLDALRERSIVHYAKGVQPPADLGSSQRISAGAGLYNEMCTGCHVGPGVEKSEMSQGLYPQAPELARGDDLTPAQQFWVIKHGVKLSAMPAWGKTHNDQLIWDMVAFLQQLPKMNPDQYKAAVASAPADHDEMMKDMPGMSDAHAPPDKGRNPSIRTHILTNAK